MKEDDEVNSPDTNITNTPSNLPSGEFSSCKESRVQQPGASGFCYRASAVFLGEIQITEGL